MNNNSISIRPMLDEDITKVIDIIDEHDEDDAEVALKDFQESGIAGHYVILLDNNIIGSSGARRIEGTDNTFKLSWTYVKKEHCGNGYGRQLLDYLIHKIVEHHGRKIFVYVSDYVDEKGHSVYAAALSLYHSLGFKKELKIEHFYDKGESLTILGLELQAIDADFSDTSLASPKITFEELYPVAETENTYSVSWKTKYFGKSFGSEEMKFMIQNAYDVKANMILLSFPSNFNNVSMPLFESGFSLIGQLKDYYENGLHEDHYVFYL